MIKKTNNSNNNNNNKKLNKVLIGAAYLDVNGN